jgi:glycolate oxidase FAD binding subunit
MAKEGRSEGAVRQKSDPTTAEGQPPASVEELREIVAGALADERAVEIVGRGTKRGLGRPVETALQVSLEAMSGIELYEPAELVMSARAGTPLAEIEARLADNQQQLAFEPPDYGPLFGGEAGTGTIGGAFACNLSGPRRIKAGAARDHFLGFTAVTGRGDLIKSGGRVMKNVTGYDLCKLFAGSFGTLGAMTELTFKVLPAPEESATLLVSGAGREAGFATLRQAMGSPYDVAGAAYLPESALAASSLAGRIPAGAGVAAIRIEGHGPSVRYRANALRSALAADGGTLEEIEREASLTLWREIRDVALLPLEADALWRLSLPPAAGPGVIAGLLPQLTFDWFGDWSGGLLWLAVYEQEDGGAAALREAIAGPGGHATLIRGSLDLRSRIEVFQPQPGGLARLTARVKESFDPKGILNPGRMYAGAIS